MMFDNRPSKFEVEQKRMRDVARQKKEKEQRLQREYEQREKEMQELAERRRAEREELEKIKQEEEENENRLTGGVKFFHVLKPYEIEGEDDKIILPESCLNELTQQDVFGQGPITFQVTAQSDTQKGRITHSGVREFTAGEGTVGLPKKVIESLLVNDSDSIEQLPKVSIKYVKMPKCTFAKLQPKHNRFFDVGPVKMVLEENLRLHSTLTVGDQLTVWYRGVAHALVVTELRPETYGNLFDTDVEVDLDLSEEYLKHNKSATLGTATDSGKATPVQSGGGSGANSASNTRSPSPAGAGASVTPAAAASTTSVFSSSQPRTLNEPSSSAAMITGSSSAGIASRLQFPQELLPEPSADGVVASDSNSTIIRVKIKLTTGKTVLRRFAVDSAFSQLFVYIGSELQLSPEQLYNVQITSQALRKSFVLVGLEDKSFQDVGLTDPNISLMMSMTAA